jgi:hypothetical protein
MQKDGKLKRFPLKFYLPIQLLVRDSGNPIGRPQIQRVPRSTV